MLPLEIVHDRAILHRDLKPGNVILRQDGTPVLIDFGAARDFRGRHSRSVTAIIARGYSPPEQYGIGGQHGPWTDLYALGAIAYRCVTGEAPVDSLARLRKDPLVPAAEIGDGKFDPGLLRTIDWMLKINEAERPQSVQQVQAALASPTGPPAAASTGGSGTETVTAATALPVAEPSPAKSRPVWLWPMVAAIVLALLGGGTFFWQAKLKREQVALTELQSCLQQSPCGVQTCVSGLGTAIDDIGPEKIGAAKDRAGHACAQKQAEDQRRQEQQAAEKKAKAEQQAYDTAASCITANKCGAQACLATYIDEFAGGKHESAIAAAATHADAACEADKKVKAEQEHKNCTSYNDGTGMSTYCVSSSSDDRPIGSGSSNNLIDDAKDTAWISQNNGVGETITVTFEQPRILESVRLVNGYNKLELGEKLFGEYNRVAGLKIKKSSDIKDAAEVESFVSDTGNTQTWSFSGDGPSVTWIRFTIARVYKGSKRDHVAISELNVVARKSPN